MSKIFSTGDNRPGQEREKSFDVARNTDAAGSSAETGKGVRQRRAPNGGQRAQTAKILTAAMLVVVAVALTIGLCANRSADATPRKDAGKMAPFNDADVRCAGVEVMTKCSYIVMWFNASSHECDGGVCVVTTDVLGRRMDEATFSAFEELGCYRELGNCACLYGPLKDLCAAGKPCESYPKLLEAGVVNAEPMTYKCEGEKMTVFRDRGEPGALENRTLIGESYLKVSPSGEVYLSPTDAVGAVDLLEGTMIIGIVEDVLTYTPYCDDLAESLCSRQVPPEVGELLPCEYAVFVDDNGLNASSAESIERFCAGKGNRRKYFA